MKKLIFLASFIIGAIAVNAQTAPLVFKTSAGAATATITKNGTATMFANVTAVGSSSITGQVVFNKTITFGTNRGYCSTAIIPVVSNDGTNFSPIKSTQQSGSLVGGTWAIQGYDTCFRGQLAVDSSLTSVQIKFPTGYKYVGFKFVGGSSDSTLMNVTSATGLAK